MPSIDDGRPDPRLDGTNGGDGLKGVTGELAKLLLSPVPVGEAGTREDVGDWAGRDGRDGPAPPAERGELCRSDGEGECSDGDPDDIVDDLKALTEVIGRRMGTPLADVPSCCSRPPSADARECETP